MSIPRFICQGLFIQWKLYLIIYHPVIAVNICAIPLTEKTNKGVGVVNQPAEKYDCFIHYYPPQGYSRLCERSNLITKRKRYVWSYVPI